MEFEISVERSGWLWYWIVSDDVFHYSGANFTKRGAIRSANRQAKRWAKQRINQAHKKTWKVKL
jgi:hypothetical protein